MMIRVREIAIIATICKSVRNLKKDYEKTNKGKTNRGVGGNYSRLKYGSKTVQST